MKFRTELNKYQAIELIDYSKKILCIGSCFAENLHNYLSYHKYNTFLNPCGIAYNPLSIAKSIRYIVGDKKLRMEDFRDKQGVYFHHDFHSRFNSTSLKRAYSNISEYLDKASEYANADVLIISLGTAYTYFLRENDFAVNNCHKIPATEFDKQLLSVNSILEELTSAISLISALNQKLEVIVTVSPVRHLKDGMIENNLSKAVLLLASHTLKNVTYFPSYELLLDDLRDYRFYDRDLVHPSAEAVDYILDFFKGQFLNVQEEQLRKEIVQVKKELAHRPFQVKSQQHQTFLLKLVEKMKVLSTKHNVDFKEEINEVKAKMR